MALVPGIGSPPQAVLSSVLGRFTPSSRLGPGKPGVRPNPARTVVPAPERPFQADPGGAPQRATHTPAAPQKAPGDLPRARGSAYVLAMRLQTSGRLHKLFETEQKSERFRLREFVLEVVDNPSYPQYVKFQLTQDRCENLDNFQEGDDVKVEFNLRGREWTNREGKVIYFNSLDVWELKKETGAGNASTPSANEPPPPTDDDDVPF